MAKPLEAVKLEVSKGTRWCAPPYGLLSWVLLLAGLLYLFNSPRVFVGTFGDDARDLLAAKSLLHGRYASLQSPEHPPLNFPLPGYPLLLAPFVAMSQGHWALMKIVPIISALGSGLLFWHFIGGSVRPLVRFILVTLFLFNPSTLYLSGVVIADTFYVCLLLSVFCLLRPLLRDPSPRCEWRLGIVLAWSVFVRPEGILLVLAVLVSLLYARRYRQASETLSLTVILGIAWIGRNLYLTHHVSGYSELWTMSLGALSDRGSLLGYWARQAITWFWEMLAGISFGSEGRWWMIIPAVAGFILSAWGFLSWLQEEEEPRGFVLCVGIFAGTFAALHALWLAVHPHYFFPLLPVSLLFLAKAVEKGSRHWSRISMIGILGATLAGTAYGVQDYLQVFSSTGMPSDSRIPASTLAWIKTYVPRDTNHKVLAVRAPTVTLYTDCYSLALLPARNVEQFRFALLTNGISHVLVEPAPILFVAADRMLDPVHIWRQTPHWLFGWPTAFRPVFRDDVEATRVYEVVPNSTFLAAYQRYQEASRMFAAGRRQTGMHLIEEAIKIDPQLTSALNAYAAVTLESGGSLALAEARLREATRLRPSFGLAWLNLARLHEKQHRMQEARREFNLAQTLLRTEE